MVDLPSATTLRFAPALASDDPPEFVLLLNPDTVLREGAIASLLEFMQRRPEVGIAGSRLEDPDGTPQISAFRFHSIASEFERGIRLGPVSKLLASKMVAQPVPISEIETDWVAGASMIIRRETSSTQEPACSTRSISCTSKRSISAWRPKRAGWKIGYVPSSRVIHLVGAASELSDARKHRKRRPTYWFDSRRRYFVKNSGVLYACLADAAFAIGFCAVASATISCNERKIVIRRRCSGTL